MFRSDWGIVGTLIGCLTLAAVGLWDSEQQRKPAQYCEQTATGADCRPQQYLSERAGLPATLERVISNPEPKTGQDHEKRDLAAQEASAVFAFWMVAISGFGALVTVIGTMLLYQQIVLTREALKDTGDATEAMKEANQIANVSYKTQMRAYVTVTSIGLSQHNDQIRVTVFLKNTGVSPATYLVLRMVAASRPGDNVDFIIVEPTMAEPTIGGAVLGCSEVFIAVRDFDVDGGYAATAGDYTVQFKGRIDYMDIFGDRHETWFSWHTCPSVRNAGMQTAPRWAGNSVS